MLAVWASILSAVQKGTFMKRQKNEPKRNLTAAALLALATTILSSSLPSYASPADRSPKFRSTPAAKTQVTPNCVSGQIIVIPKQSTDKDEMAEALEQVNGKIVKTITMGSKTFNVIEVDKKDFAKSFETLKKDKRFENVSLNMKYHATAFPFGLPNDPDIGLQPQLQVHGIPGGWRMAANLAAAGATGATIGILDTGVQGTNTDLTPHVLTGFNAVTNAPPGNVDLGPGFFHGTFCAALMACLTNNANLGASLDYNALINPVDVFNGVAGTDTATLINGLAFLDGQPGVRFVNVSVNGAPPNTLNADPAWIAAVTQFDNDKSGLVFNSAGNDGLPDISPRNNFNIVVGGVDSNLHRASFSNFGPAVTFTGLAVGDGSTDLNGTALINADGTSFSCPMICSIAAGMSRVNPSLSGQQILARMKAVAHNVNQGQGFGLVRADEALFAAAH